MAHVVSAAGVDRELVLVRSPHVTEGLAPNRRPPDLEGIPDRVRGLVAEDHHQVVRRVAVGLVVHQAPEDVVRQVPGQVDGGRLIGGPELVLPQVEARPPGDAPGLQFRLQAREAIP